ncbi:hypothetical protein HanRHA438_Chr12g0547021 [Helianthus annuus]|nr:hypothetical protein HanRHA438_Chr12g0547021 [Helianthus annuus]
MSMIASRTLTSPRIRAIPPWSVHATNTSEHSWKTMLYFVELIQFLDLIGVWFLQIFLAIQLHHTFEKLVQTFSCSFFGHL